LSIDFQRGALEREEVGVLRGEVGAIIEGVVNGYGNSDESFKG